MYAITFPPIQYFLLVALIVSRGSSAWISSSSSTIPRHDKAWKRRRPTLHATRDKGFAQKKNDQSNDDKSSSKPIYSQPALYDLAFGYRDFDREVEFLWQRHVQVTGAEPTGILEVAAGPARHAMAALQLYSDDDTSPLQAVHALDNSIDMQAYAQETALHELSVDEKDKFTYHVGDMRAAMPHLAASVDTAWILLGSLQHLTSNADVRACFDAMHDVLRPNGTLMLELPHPRETFSMVSCTRNGWKVPLEDVEDGSEAGELSIIWGDDDDAFDPVSQVRQFTVQFTLTHDGDSKNNDLQLRQVVPMRLFTAQEVDALATASGFRVVSYHGALEDDVSVQDEDAAYRLVVVLQKV